MASIRVDIVSAEGEIFSGEAEMVFAPGQLGEIGIPPRHAPLLTDLKPGEVRVQPPEGEERVFYVSGGILEVQPQRVTVLANSALRAEDLDEAAAFEAREKAREALEEEFAALEEESRRYWEDKQHEDMDRSEEEDTGKDRRDVRQNMNTWPSR